MFAMNRNRAARTTLFVLLVLACAGGVLAQAKLDPIRWSIDASTPQPVKAGEKFTIQVTAKMDEGWHLYSLEQEPGGPIPTRIRMPEDQPFRLVDMIDSPAPRVEMDPNFNMETQFFEDEVSFSLPIVIADSTPAGKHELRVNITYQTCTATKCLPPKLVKLVAEIPVATSQR